MVQAMPQFVTAFIGQQRLASGRLAEVALAVMKASSSAAEAPILIFDDANGRPLDLDLRGSEREIVARLPQPAPNPEASAEDLSAPEPRGRGRPKLGVVAREVTLLPRHWEWLGTQPGGASVALRKLVEAARRASGDRDRSRAAQRCRLSFHVGDGRQSAGLRGGLARVVRRRPAAVCRPDRRLARRHPRSHRQARLQRPGRRLILQRRSARLVGMIRII